MLFKNLNKVALALAMTLFLGACATQQATTTTTTSMLNSSLVTSTFMVYMYIKALVMH
jgi:hypothetical protein